jgi:hypothetical protein
MKPFHAVTYYILGSLLANMKQELAKTDADRKALKRKKGALPGLLASISRLCSGVNLRVSSGYISEIRNQLHGMANSTLAVKLNELHSIIVLELREQLFMFLPPEEARFYDKNNLLKPLASENFSSALKEITEAGSCYACGLNTASVFHSMRALEKPFRVLAKELRVQLSKEVQFSTWGELHREIDERIVGLRSQKQTKKRNEELAFYCQANLEFGYFKDAWRNFVMHVHKDYDGPQAISALNHVIAFVEILATRLKESEKKKRTP